MEFDIKLFKQVRETKEVEKMHAGKKEIGWPKELKDQDGMDANDADESKVNESWFAKEKLSRMKARLAKVQKLYKKYPKDSEKYEREGVSLENDIKELEAKVADIKRDIKAVEETKVDEAKFRTGDDVEDDEGNTGTVLEVKGKKVLVDWDEGGTKNWSNLADIHKFQDDIDESKLNEATEVFKNDKVKVLRIEDKEDAITYGKDTSWEIANPNEENNYFSQYYFDNKKTIYYVVDLTGKALFAVMVDPQGKKEVFDAQSKVVNPSDLTLYGISMGAGAAEATITNPKSLNAVNNLKKVAADQGKSPEEIEKLAATAIRGPKPKVNESGSVVGFYIYMQNQRGPLTRGRLKKLTVPVGLSKEAATDWQEARWELPVGYADLIAAFSGTEVVVEDDGSGGIFVMGTDGEAVREEAQDIYSQNMSEATIADPITTPTTKPATKPKTPLAPQPNIQPKPKALNQDVDLFVKARENKVDETKTICPNCNSKKTTSSEGGTFKCQNCGRHVQNGKCIVKGEKGK